MSEHKWRRYLLSTIGHVLKLLKPMILSPGFACLDRISANQIKPFPISSKKPVLSRIWFCGKKENARKNVPKSGKITIQEPKKKFWPTVVIGRLKRVIPAVKSPFRSYLLYCISLFYKALRKLRVYPSYLVVGKLTKSKSEKSKK